MKPRYAIAAATGLIVIAGLAWLIPDGQPDTPTNTEAAIADGIEQRQPVSQPRPAPAMQTTVAMQPTLIERSTAALPAPAVPALTADVATMHAAQPGETLSGIAAALPGNDGIAYRNAIINANPSLIADPDMLVAGTEYLIPARSDLPSRDATTPVSAIEGQPQRTPAQQKSDSTVLRYTARPGDTVVSMALAFLGSGSKDNQHAIISANASLSSGRHPLVVGYHYRIPAPDGLSASAAPTTRPAGAQLDADSVIARGAPRLLRYTARRGDTVTHLAIELLGSDTAEARNSIINSNPTLKADPDRVIAGQTYTIVAPASTTP